MSEKVEKTESGVDEFLRERREEVEAEERYDAECRRLYGRRPLTSAEIRANMARLRARFDARQSAKSETYEEAKAA